MDLEIQVAVKFIISYLYNKLPRRRVDIFGEELDKKLSKKFKGHWYPDRPTKGSGYRCILVHHNLDPVLASAAKEGGLDVEDVKANLPGKLTVWIDPNEVSYRIGEQGPVKVILNDFRREDSGSGSGSDNELCEYTNSWVEETGRFSPKGKVPFHQRKNTARSPVQSVSPVDFEPVFGNYASWSKAEISQPKARSRESQLSPNAKEFVYPTRSAENQSFPSTAEMATLAQNFALWGRDAFGFPKASASQVSSSYQDWFNVGKSMSNYQQGTNFHHSLPIMA